ncbi:hypothetical protein MHYP_G00263150 [Metynnis hypsauchen]
MITLASTILNRQAKSALALRGKLQGPKAEVLLLVHIAVSRAESEPLRGSVTHTFWRNSLSVKHKQVGSDGTFQLDFPRMFVRWVCLVCVK